MAVETLDVCAIEGHIPVMGFEMGLDRSIGAWNTLQRNREGLLRRLGEEDRR